MITKEMLQEALSGMSVLVDNRDLVKAIKINSLGVGAAFGAVLASTVMVVVALGDIEDRLKKMEQKETKEQA